MGADLFFLPLYMYCGSLALSGRKIGSSIIPRLSLVILLIACLGAAVVVVVDVVVVSGLVVAGASVEITALSSVKKNQYRMCFLKCMELLPSNES